MKVLWLDFPSALDFLKHGLVVVSPDEAAVAHISYKAGNLLSSALFRIKIDFFYHSPVRM